MNLILAIEEEFSIEFDEEEISEIMSIKSLIKFVKNKIKKR
jgi:acyl carrier protein